MMLKSTREEMQKKVMDAMAAHPDGLLPEVCSALLVRWSQVATT
jgi:hypothetical protein